MAGARPRALIMEDNAFNPLGFGTHHPAPSLASPSQEVPAYPPGSCTTSTHVLWLPLQCSS